MPPQQMMQVDFPEWRIIMGGLSLEKTCLGELHADRNEEP